MADVQPLHGLRYQTDRVRDLAQVLSPPFDVIDTDAQRRYYERNPYNVIRLELGEQYPTDTMLNTVYALRMASERYFAPGVGPLLLPLPAEFYTW